MCLDLRKGPVKLNVLEEPVDVCNADKAWASLNVSLKQEQRTEKEGKIFTTSFLRVFLTVQTLS